MKLVYRCIFLAVLSLVCGLFLVRGVKKSWMKEIQDNQESIGDDIEPHLASVYSYSGNETNSVIHLVLVVCGERLKQAITCIKSAILFARSPLKVHIFAENEVKEQLEDQLHRWRNSFSQQWTFVVQELSFPAESQNEWKTLFKPCAAQRLFLPSTMIDTDAVIYVDIDTLFLSPIDILWDKFNMMNSSQMAALVPESEDFSTGWYNRFARHPYYGSLGLNSGVMLMNLTRFRRFQWELYLVPTYQYYKVNITWGDQDIINIIFHFHADKVLVLPCEFNYRPDHCMYMSVCRTIEKNGVHVLHGNRGSFINKKQPAFRAFYDSFNEFIPGEKLASLVELIFAKFDTASSSNCGKMRKFLLKNLE